MQTSCEVFFQNATFEESEIFLLQLEGVAGSSLCHSVEAAVCCFMSFTDVGLFFFFLWWFKACLDSKYSDSSCANL